MTPVPALPKLLERGQTVLDFSGSSTVRIKPGKLAKLTSKVPSQMNRQWMSNSLYENQLARQFKAARLMHCNPDESDPEGIALHRLSYSQELKLAAIE
jgi:hypothetical protein